MRETTGDYRFDGIEAEPEEAQVARKRSILRTAFVLFFFGSLAIVLGLFMWSEGFDTVDWAVAFGLGAMCLIPGMYVTFLAYGAHKGWSGYSWESLPGYYDEMEQT